MRKRLHSVTKEAHNFKKDLEVADIEPVPDEPATAVAKKIKQQTRKQTQKKMREKWEEKPMHGQYPSRIHRADTDQEKTNKWLMSSGLKGETEGLIIAAQDQSLLTNSYQSRIIKNGTDPMCRLCHDYEETVEHIISGCPALAKGEYLHRHNKSAGYIHWKLCRHFEIPVSDNWYDHKPDPVTENANVTILWDMPVHTDREIRANRPDTQDKNAACSLI